MLSACSIYESQGRKFLEENASTSGCPSCVSAQANLLSCDRNPSTTAWTPLESNPRANLWASEGENFELRVSPTDDTEYNCYFRFSSAQEMYAKSDSAIALTLHLRLAD
jgi:hypothetical protein